MFKKFLLVSLLFSVSVFAGNAPSLSDFQRASQQKKPDKTMGVPEDAYPDGKGGFKVRADGGSGNSNDGADDVSRSYVAVTTTVAAAQEKERKETS